MGDIAARPAKPRRNKASATGAQTRVARVRAEYPNQLDYSGSCKLNKEVFKHFKLFKM